VDYLNSLLEQGIKADRFRANVVIQQLDRFEEDNIKSLQGPGYRIDHVKPCSRCIVINTDQMSGERYKEPLAKLAEFRKFEGKVRFGQNALISNDIWLNIGDHLEVK